MLAHAPLLGESRARWTRGLAVTVVLRRVHTGVLALARQVALGGLGAAGDGGQQNLSTAPTGQLVEARLPARGTVATVTGFLAAVQPTRQLLPTDLLAAVLVLL